MRSTPSSSVLKRRTGCLGRLRSRESKIWKPIMKTGTKRSISSLVTARAQKAPTIPQLPCVLAVLIGEPDDAEAKDPPSYLPKYTAKGGIQRWFLYHRKIPGELCRLLG